MEGKERKARGRRARRAGTGRPAGKGRPGTRWTAPVGGYGVVGEKAPPNCPEHH